MYHLWRMGDDGQWLYLGPLGQSAMERNLRGARTNTAFFAIPA